MKYFLTAFTFVVLALAVFGCEDETKTPTADVADVEAVEEDSTVTDADAATAPADVSATDVAETEDETSD